MSEITIDELGYVEEMRQRLGLERDDKSLDESIVKMEPMERVRLIAGWYQAIKASSIESRRESHEKEDPENLHLSDLVDCIHLLLFVRTLDGNSEAQRTDRANPRLMEIGAYT